MSVELPEGFRWRVQREYDIWDALWLRLQKRGRFGIWKTVYWKYVSIEADGTAVPDLIESAKPNAWDAYTRQRSTREAVEDVIRQHKQLP